MLDRCRPLRLLGVLLLLTACAPDLNRNLDLQRDVLLDHDDPNFGATHPGTGEVEDRLNSTEIAFPRRTITGGSRDDRLAIRIDFVDRPSGEPQYLVLAAAGTGFNNPETFADRPLADIASHDFDPGVVWRNTAGAVMEDREATGRLFVTLHGVNGELDRNFYWVDVTCGPAQCTGGAHFPDRADCVVPSACADKSPATQDLTDSRFAFDGVTFDLYMDGDCHGGCAPVTLDRLQFYMLGGDMLVINTATP